MVDLQPTKIILQTRKGNPIDNYQYPVLSVLEKGQFRLDDKKYEKVCDPRGEPTGIYNCHGMVFASRRTCIHDASEIQKILQDDGYIPVAPEDVRPGDIVLYSEPETGDFSHSAVVIIEPAKNEFGIPRLLSKWGKYREVLHYANQGPYRFDNPKYYRILE